MGFLPETRTVTAERRLPEAPGPVVTRLVLRLGLHGGELATPRGGPEGIRLEIRRRRWRGQGDVVVMSDETGTRVVLRGRPPAWPFSVGWAERTLRNLLGE